MPYRDKEAQKAYQREWTRLRTLNDKKTVIDLLGGKCIRCEYSDNINALELDHITPLRRKVVGEDSGNNNYRKILNGTLDIKLFQILCANCHAIKTYEERRILGI